MFYLLGLLPNFFIEVVVNFLQWYEFACWTKEFEELKLTTMDKYIRSMCMCILDVYTFIAMNLNGLVFMQFSNELCAYCRTVDSFRTHLKRWQKSHFNLVKVHNMKYYASSIWQFGAPIEYSSNMYEHLHIAMIKMGYQMSNKRNFLHHIVKCNRRIESLRSNESEIDGYSCFFGENATLEKVCSKKSI